MISLATVGAVAAGAIVAGAIVSGTPGRALAATTSAGLYVGNSSGLYVDNSASAHCSNSSSASGSEATPFCTIQAAVNSLRPSGTIIVEPGTYQPVSLDETSGITLQAVTYGGATATIDATGHGSAFELIGAEGDSISGFDVEGAGAAYSIDSQSTGISISGGRVTVPAGGAGVDIGSSWDITVSGVSFVGGTGVRMQAEPPNEGGSVVIAENTFVTSGEYPAVDDMGAPAAYVTGNTLYAQCGPAIALSEASYGASNGSSVYDNIVSEWGTSGSQCTGPDAATGILVSATSTSGTTADYNLINPSGITALYDWGGTSYPTLAAFTTATRQGTHDIAGDPKFSAQHDTVTVGVGGSIYYVPGPGSPAINSADADALGEQSTDQLGNPRADDPNVANSGTGSGGVRTGYYDRGAIEVEGPVTEGGAKVVPSGSLTVTASAHVTTSWTTNGPIGVYSFDFDGARYPLITTSPSVTQAFPAAGFHSVAFAMSYGGGPINRSPAAGTVVGAGYTPVTPERILDTRTGTGTGKAAAVPAGGTLTLSLPSVGGVPATAMAAVVMNVTVTRPKAGGYLTVYPGSGTPPKASNLHFQAGKTAADLVTVQVSGGKVSFHNGSGGTVQVIADLAGYYGPAGDGFQPRAPIRVLDTRNGTGVAAGPLAPLRHLRLNLSGKVSAGTAAVVLNVTVSKPQQPGYLSVYPDGLGQPATSSLNFKPGQTVANQVIVPLRNGIADFYNESAGTVQVVADLNGYFGASATDFFVPYGPVRADDTRADGKPVRAFATHSLPARAIESPACTPACPAAVAAVDTMTVTQPAKAGYLTLYPGFSSRPLASTLDFPAGQTIANLATTQVGRAGTIDAYNGSPGTIELITDEFGYYIPSP